MTSGVVSLANTKFSFYSKSATIYILIEMSSEMFDFDEGSNFMQLEKCIHFVRAYLERCKHEASSHEITFILYGRLFYPTVKNKQDLRQKLCELLKNPNLTEDELNRSTAFKFSHHTRAF